MNLNLVMDNLLRGLEHNKHSDFMSPSQYVREYRTIILGVPRYVGKTKYIQHNAKCGDLIVVRNLPMVKMYEDNFRLAMSADTFKDLFRARRGLTRLHTSETIWFDEVMLNDTFAHTLEYLLVSREQKIICMGTF